LRTEKRGMKRRVLLRAGAWISMGFSAGYARALPANYQDHDVRLYSLHHPGEMLFQWNRTVYVGEYNDYQGRRDEDHDYLWRITYVQYKDDQGFSKEGFEIVSWNSNYLQGRPLNGTVGLGGLYDNDVHWDIIDSGDGGVFIRCQSRVPGPLWLESRPNISKDIPSVGLAHNAQPSTKWQIAVAPNALDNLNSYFGNRRR
jgi:hypothetical protein